MDMQEFIPIDIFCRQYGIEISVISSLQDYGLLEISSINETACLPVQQIADAERLVHLHEDLAINVEGIDVISHLLQRIQSMQSEIQSLKNRLRLYESI